MQEKWQRTEEARTTDRSKLDVCSKDDRVEVKSFRDHT
jgi:hypothetical protein